MGRTNSSLLEHGCSAMDDVMGNMAIVSRRARDGRPVRNTVVTPAPGFGGGKLYCSHASSRRCYVGANFEGAMVGRLLGVGPLWGRSLGLTAFLQPATWTSRP